MTKLLIALLLAASIANAATTTVSGAVTDANGTAATGRVLISWPSFIAVGGALVPAGSKSVSFTGGALSVALEPNVGATPSGTSYTLRFSGATMNATEYWVVPNTGTATIAAVRTSIQPNPSATISLAALSLAGAAEGYVLKIVSGTPAWAAAGGGGAGDAYSFVTDGTTTPAASGADTLKFRTASSLLSIAAGSNDPTHGDNLLFTVNADNLSITESQISDLAHFSGVYGDLTSIPSTFAPAAHVLNSATHTVSGLTTGQLLQATGATSFGFANLAQAQVTAHQAALAIAWAQLTGVPSTFAPSAHSLTGADHTASGLTTGHVLSATGATTFGFGALAASQIPALDTAKITTGTFADARISEASVTQHEAALSITESQISDLAHTVDTTKTIQDEGTPLTQRATLNFVGAGVSCADDTTKTTCTIPGGGGGGDGEPNFDESFTAQTSVELNHAFGHDNLIVSCYDNAGAEIIPESTTIGADPFYVTVTFGSSTTGRCVVNGSAGGEGGGGAEVNALEGDGAEGIADAEVFIGTGPGTGAYAPLSGDVTMTNAGVAAVANDSHTHTGSTVSGLDAADTTSGTFDDARLPAEVPLTDEANTFTQPQTFEAGIVTGDGTIPGSHHFYETSANGDNYYRVVGDPDIGSNGCAILPDDGTGADGETLLFTSATQTVDGDTCRELDTVDVATQSELNAHDHNGGDGAQIPAGGISSVDGDTATIQLRRASDCTAETGGVISEQCVDTDDGAMFVCVPSAGTCDTSGEWIEVGAGGGGGGASELDDLTDVTITTPTTDDVLKYNGSAWINVNLLTALGEDLATTACVVFKSGSSVGCDADLTFNGAKLHLGTGSANGITFGDDDSGIYETADDQLYFDLPASNDWRLTGTNFASAFTSGTPSLSNQAVAVTNPAYAFVADTNTGLYWISADTFGVAAGGVKVAGFGVNGLQLADPGTKPTCDSAVRGTIWHEFGGAGVADTVEVCSKDASDAYAWRTLQ